MKTSLGKAVFLFNKIKSILYFSMFIHRPTIKIFTFFLHFLPFNNMLLAIKKKVLSREQNKLKRKRLRRDALVNFIYDFNLLCYYMFSSI